MLLTENYRETECVEPATKSSESVNLGTNVFAFFTVLNIMNMS